MLLRSDVMKLTPYLRTPRPPPRQPIHQKEIPAARPKARPGFAAPPAPPRARGSAEKRRNAPRNCRAIDLRICFHCGFAFCCESFLARAIKTSVEEFFVLHQDLRNCREHLLRHCARLAEKLARRHDTIDEAPIFRLRR